MRAIRQYFHPPNCLQYDVINTYTLLRNLRMRDKYVTYGMEFAFSSCVRGHHVSKEFWTPNIGEELSCQREEGNPNDPYAVAVKTEAGTVIGHVPRKISAACCLFLRRSGTIVCEITGSRQASADLPQGGLEVPCTFKFAGEKEFVDKIKKLLPPSPRLDSTELAKATHTSSDKQPSHSDVAITVGDEETASDDNTVQSEVQSYWLTVNKISLLDEDRRIIATGEELNDKHINFVQSLLKKQFKDIQGLTSTLLLTSSPGHPIVSNGLHIIHTRGSHWIVATTIGCTDEVLVFDTLYSTVDKLTKELILNTFGVRQLRMEKAHKQKGVKDCGVFAIAIATSLAHFGLNGAMACTSFNQSGMRDHLLLCFENMCLTPFPQ